MRAKKENDKCVVFVSWNDDDRWSKYGLPLSKRYRLVKKFFEKDKSIIVLKIDDSALWLDDSRSWENRKFWLSNAYDQIYQQQLCWDITWYVSELSYKEAIDNVINKGLERNS